MSMTYRRLLRALLGVVIATFMLVPVAPPASAEPASSSAAFDVCDAMPTQIGKIACQLATGDDPIIPLPTDVGSIAGDVVASAGETATMSFFRTLGRIIDLSVISALENYSNTINDRTTPNLNETWYTNMYAMMYAIAIVAAIIFGIKAMLAGAKEGSLVATVRAPVLVGLLIGAGGFVATYINLGIWVSDQQVTPQIMQGTLQDVNAVVLQLQSAALSAHRYDIVVMGPLVMGFFGSVAGPVMEFVLWFRKFALFFMPFWWINAFAAYIGGTEEGQAQFKKANIATFGLIALKPASAIVLNIGLNGFLLSGNSNDGFLVTAFALLAMPFVVWWAIVALIKYDPKPTRKIKVITNVVKRLT